MRPHLKIGAALLALLTAATAHAAVFVNALTSTPTLIGPIVAGQTYTVTATGIADLLNGFNGGRGLTFTADGIPTYTFPPPYTGFNPNGLDHDPSQSGTVFCVGGAGRLCGGLLGTFTATPSGPTDFFFLGSSDTFTAPLNGFLFGLVNDCPNCFADNDPESGFNVTLALAAVGVPEPRTWAMMLLGFGLLGFALRRQRQARAEAVGAV
ncbi:MAG TPA: PEPxxWA-CTERM sorting domain-containing protein [Sphingomicrobium sp.]|nr:PEPxxWA-CTERM sorting domain-containing protein [Sphingomicrobium sp.]